MKNFKLFLLAALAFGFFPAVSGACDGLFGRFAEHRSESVFGFGVVKARKPKTALPPTTAKKVPVAQAPPVKPASKPAFKCLNGQCFQ